MAGSMHAIMQASKQRTNDTKAKRRREKNSYHELHRQRDQVDVRVVENDLSILLSKNQL